MRTPGIKDIKTAIKVLSAIDCEVDKSLLVYLSALLRGKEEAKRKRRLENMSDEELAVADARVPRKLRVTRKDGSIILGRKNCDVFVQAIIDSHADYGELCEILVSRKPLVIKRTKGAKMKGYCLLHDDLFVYRKLSSKEMVEILRRIDECKQMYWDIELL